MLFEFNQFCIDIDVASTKDFYEKAKFITDSCSCDGCMNFAHAVENLPEIIKEFFSKIGIDMKKICECYVNCTNTDGTLLYGGFYHVCGTMQRGQSAWVKCSETTAYWNEKFTYLLSPNFQISFQNEIHLLEDNFPLPVLQLEILANIPWVLQKSNPCHDSNMFTNSLTKPQLSD